MRFKNIKDLKGNIYDFSLSNKKLIFPACKTDQIVNFEDDIYVSPGWIDIHTHCNPENNFVGSNPDEIGYQSGVCLLIDAGSLGINNLDQLFLKQNLFKTNIKVLLNISKIGIPGQYELNDLNNIDINYDQKKYQDFVIGYKARISGSVVGENGVQPLVKFNELRKTNPLPVMIHLGNQPPTFAEIVANLSRNDILTHVFNGKNDEIFNAEKTSVILKEALNQGIKIDVGHGTSSFDSRLFQKVLLKSSEFQPNFISTDIYNGNIHNGIVKDLGTTMSKMHALGMKWNDVIDCVTINPANHFKIKNFGQIDSQTNNLTFFKIIKGTFLEKDSKNQIILMKEKIVPVGIIINGEFFKIDKPR